MSSTPIKNTKKTKTSLRRKCRRRTFNYSCKRNTQKSSVRDNGKVSEKLEALKKLIPNNNTGDVAKAEQLFQETADYIVLLKTQVLVLHKLIEFYGSSTGSNHENNVVS